MLVTSMTEDMIRELANGIPPDRLVPELARLISHVEGVRVYVNRLAENRRREDARHRDALAAIGAELAEWQAQCPHPCHTFGQPCSVCGLLRTGSPVVG